MRQEQFEALHQADWAAFDRWLRAGTHVRRSSEKDNAPEVFDASQAPKRYRQLCQHLALARERNFSLALVEHLHRMVQEGHDALYGARTGFIRQALRYLAGGFAAEVRANWRWVLASGILFFGSYIAAMIVIRIWPNFIFTLIPYGQVMEMRAMYSDSFETLRSQEFSSRFVMFGFYIFNNISIAFRCFAGGLMLGIGAIYVLIFNGFMIGAVEGDLVGTMGLGRNFYSFVVGHSGFELGAIVLSGAAGLKLGLALLMPGQRTRKEALRHVGKSVTGIIWGSTIMLVCAAMTEAFWSPLALPLSIKLTVGFCVTGLILAYFLLAGRGLDPNESGRQRAD